MTTEMISTFFALSAIALLAAAAGLAGVWLAAGRWEAAAAWKKGAIASLGPHSLRYAWLIALVAMLGSLYFSEIAGFIPCEFCWYQRIAMYPLVLVLGIAAIRNDRGIWRYGIPLAATGAGLSIYHLLIQHFPQLAASSCSATAPCTAAWVQRFGFVSIPFMALACFVAITWLLAIGRDFSSDNG